MVLRTLVDVACVRYDANDHMAAVQDNALDVIYTWWVSMFFFF